jgi:hypothetical protein
MRARNQQNGSGLLPTPIWNRFQRCRALAPPSEAEIAAMVSDFLSQGGAVNRVPNSLRRADYGSAALSVGGGPRARSARLRRSDTRVIHSYRTLRELAS